MEPKKACPVLPGLGVLQKVSCLKLYPVSVSCSLHQIPTCPSIRERTELGSRAWNVLKWYLFSIWGSLYKDWDCRLGIRLLFPWAAPTTQSFVPIAGPSWEPTSVTVDNQVFDYLHTNYWLWLWHVTLCSHLTAPASSLGHHPNMISVATLYHPLPCAKYYAN